MEEENDGVVITGIGVITPFGVGVDLFLKNIMDGQSAIREIKSFDTRGFDYNKGGEIPDFDPHEFICNTDAELIPRTSQLAIAASKLACKDAGISQLPNDAVVGVCFGTTMGNQSVVEDLNDSILQSTRTSFSANTYPPVQISRQVATELKTTGPVMTFPTACAAGNYAIGAGYDLLRSNRADIVIAGGSDAMARGCYAIFNRLRAIAKGDCKPFDKDRTGMLVGEGSAALILERESSAKKRGARIYAKLLGYGVGCDAHHPTAPHPDGKGLVMAIKSAISDAGITIQDVNYINAHGTGTIANDFIESKAIRQVFGDITDNIYISSCKSMFGHAMGGASAIEAVACVLAVYHGEIPPTINHTTLDPNCLTNIVPNKSKKIYPNIVINNGIGFGGNIAVIVLGVN